MTNRNAWGWVRPGVCATVVAAAVLSTAGGCSESNLGDQPGGGGSSAGSGSRSKGGQAQIPQGGDGPVPHPVARGGTGGTTTIVEVVGGYSGDVSYGGTGEVEAQGGGDYGPYGALDCNTCSEIATAYDLRAIATNDSSVYWADHGTYDRLRNHHGDGKLLSRPLAGGDPQTINDKLEGPIDVALSSAYAYVLLDESTAAEGKGGLSRVPLAGGDAEPLRSFESFQIVTLAGRLAVSAGAAYWLEGTTIYRAAEATQAAVSTFADATGVSEIFGDDQQLYEYGPTAIYTVPAGGGDRTLLRELQSPSYYGFKLADGYIYAIDDRGYLARMPRAGGAMKRVANPGNIGHVFVSGDRFISDPGDWDLNVRQIVQQSLSQGTQHILVEAAPHKSGAINWDAMADSQVGLFFENQQHLYLVPHAD